MWKHRILYLAAVITAVVMYIIADRKEALALVCMLLLTPVVSRVVQRRAMADAQLYIDAKKNIYVGEKLPVTLSIRRKRRTPMGVIKVTLHIENYLFQETKEIVLNLQTEEKREMVFSYSPEVMESGKIIVKAVQMEFYDLLGMFCWKKETDIVNEIFIHPPEIQMSVGLSKRKESRNFGKLYHPFKKGQDVSEISNLRDYVPGDEINRIHWKLSAKFDKVIIKEFGYPANYDTLILYEVMKEANGKQIPNKNNVGVLALTIALSEAFLRLNVKHTVGHVYSGEWRTMNIDSIRKHEEMATQILCVPIDQEQNYIQMLDTFVKDRMYLQYTKIIYVTSKYQDEVTDDLSDKSDLTIVHVTEGAVTNYELSEKYMLVSIGADEIGSAAYTLEI